MFIMPTIVESVGGGREKYYDIPSKLFQSRIVILHGEITDETSLSINSQLLYLDSENNNPITLLIESPGGSLIAALSIMDTMNRIKSPVSTVATGYACSGGSFLLGCGEKGLRKASKSCRIMLHSMSHGTGGVIHDTRIAHKEGEYLQQYYTKIIADNCNKTFEEVDKDIERDLWLSADEALEYGLIDEVI